MLSIFSPPHLVFKLIPLYFHWINYFFLCFDLPAYAITWNSLRNGLKSFNFSLPLQNGIIYSGKRMFSRWNLAYKFMTSPFLGRENACDFRSMFHFSQFSPSRMHKALRSMESNSILECCLLVVLVGGSLFCISNSTQSKELTILDKIQFSF